MELKKKLFLVVVFIGVNKCVMSESVDQIGSENFDDQVTAIRGYVQLAASVISHGCSFFRKEKFDYDLQENVLNIPYKKMIYLTMQDIELLLDDANKHDNPIVQIKALILLFRVPVPEWYVKSFHKGLDTLYKVCFDEDGNFKDTAGLGDIRLIFKDYCRKVPASWQDIAKMSDWWFKNKKPSPVYTKYYAHTCTDYNEYLLNMIEVAQQQDFVFLRYLLLKDRSKAARKIYDYQFSVYFKEHMNDFDARK